MKVISSTRESTLDAPQVRTYNLHQIYNIPLTFFDVIHVVHFPKASHIERKTDALTNKYYTFQERQEMKT